MRLTLALILGLFAIYWSVAVSGPRAVGLWQDDAIYLCTAKSLTEGRGYRHIQIPETPLQTKYPILYPALLTPGFLFGPPYPRNLPWLLAPSALAAAGLVALAVHYWRKVFQEDWRLILLGAVLAACSPVLLSFVRFTMSDLPYAVLAMATVLVIDHHYSHAVSARTRRTWLVVGAVLASLAVLTRGIGLTLAAAFPILLLFRRAWKDAALWVLIMAICLAPWQVRQMLAMRANGPMQDALLTAPELSYALWLPHSLTDTARVIGQNTLRLLFGLLYLQLAFPSAAVARCLQAPSWATVGLHLAAWLAGLLLLVGFLCSVRQRLRLLHVYAVLYAAVTLAWPFEPYRFLIPWTPFLLYFLLTGLTRVAGAAHRARWIRGAAAALIGLLLLVAFIRDNLLIVTSTERRYFLREFPIDWTEVRAVEEWVAANTRPDDRLAAANNAALFLSTGRTGHYFWPDTDPYRLFYGPDRDWRTFCVQNSDSEGRHLLQELEHRLDQVYREAGIAYYIEHREIDVGLGAMSRYVRARPERFVPVFRTPGGTFTVFRLRWSQPTQSAGWPARS